MGLSKSGPPCCQPHPSLSLSCTTQTWSGPPHQMHGAFRLPAGLPRAHLSRGLHLCSPTSSPSGRGYFPPSYNPELRVPASSFSYPCCKS